jgi:hypothetical protein
LPVSHGKPLPADHGKENSARLQCLCDGYDEVGAEVNRIDVLEDRATTKMINKPVEQPARRVRGIFTTVADENRATCWLSRYSHDHRPLTLRRRTPTT